MSTRIFRKNWHKLSMGALMLISQQACMTTQSAPLAHDDALYQALGGKLGIAQISHELVVGFGNDPLIKQKFDGVDMEKLERLIAEQFCALSGGPCVYSGREMHKSHDALDVTNAEFNRAVEDLQAAMDRLHVASSTQNRLLALLAPMQHSIVTR